MIEKIEEIFNKKESKRLSLDFLVSELGKKNKIDLIKILISIKNYENLTIEGEFLVLSPIKNIRSTLNIPLSLAEHDDEIRSPINDLKNNIVSTPEYITGNLDEDKIRSLFSDIKAISKKISKELMIDYIKSETKYQEEEILNFITQHFSNLFEIDNDYIIFKSLRRLDIRIGMN